MSIDQSATIPSSAAVRAAVRVVTALHKDQVADLEALNEAWERGDIGFIDALTEATENRWERIRLAYGALHDLYPGRLAPTDVVKPLVTAFYAALGNTPDTGELAERAAQPKRVRRAA